MAKSSINFKPVKANSTRHNERIGELDYVYQDLTRNNESLKTEEISTRYDKIAKLTKELTGRKIQAKATPIREAVVNLDAHHTLEDLKRLAANLRAYKGISCFQIHIHRDEGKSRSELNYHAHMLFDWQDKKTGKSFKLLRHDMSEIQDIVSQTLDMDRGELKENSNRERLEAVEYKRQQEEQRLQELQDQVKVLEQKKNRAAEANRKAREGHSSFEELAALYAEQGVPQYRKDLRSQSKELDRALELQQEEAKQQQEEFEHTEADYQRALRDKITLASTLKEVEEQEGTAKHILRQQEEIKQLETRIKEARKGQQS